jgi:hypothetical protein
MTVAAVSDKTVIITVAANASAVTQENPHRVQGHDPTWQSHHSATGGGMMHGRL